MLRHTNTGRVSVLNVTHFGREREGGIAAEEKKNNTKKNMLFALGRGAAVSPGRGRGGGRGLLGRVEPQLVDVPQEAEESAHLFAADGGGQVRDLDDVSPRNPAHCDKWRKKKSF